MLFLAVDHLCLGVFWRVLLFLPLPKGLMQRGVCVQKEVRATEVVAYSQGTGSPVDTCRRALSITSALIAFIWVNIKFYFSALCHGEVVTKLAHTKGILISGLIKENASGKVVGG